MMRHCASEADCELDADAGILCRHTAFAVDLQVETDKLCGISYTLLESACFARSFATLRAVSRRATARSGRAGRNHPARFFFLARYTPLGRLHACGYRAE